MVNNFRIFRKDKNRYVGGIMFYENVNLPCISITVEIDNLTGTIFLQVNVQSSKWLFVACWKPTTQVAQRRCDNVVTTSWLTLSQRCGKVENESWCDVSFRRCDNVVVPRCQDVATTLLRRRYNINQWLCRCFLITCNC